MTKEEMIEDIQFRITTIMDLNGKDSVAKHDIATICGAFCKGTDIQVRDVLEEAQGYWDYLQETMDDIHPLDRMVADMIEERTQ